VCQGGARLVRIECGRDWFCLHGDPPGAPIVGAGLEQLQASRGYGSVTLD